MLAAGIFTTTPLDSCMGGYKQGKIYSEVHFSTKTLLLMMI
jgi:hypothetical protein